MHKCFHFNLCAQHVLNGWNDVGFHGNNYVSTPNIDALAYSGVILNQHYVAPMCSPTRSSLLSGRFSTSNGMWQRVINASQPYGLHIQEKLMPQYLKDHGYSTNMVGKWHLGNHKQIYTPTSRGFDTYFGHWNARIDYYNHSHVSMELIDGINRRFNGYDLHDGNYSSPLHTGKYVTHLYTDRAEKLIQKHDTSEPFLLYLAYATAHIGNPHACLQAPSETIDKFSYIANPQRRVLAAMIYEMDMSIGRIMQALKDRDMLENSIVVFASDNGGSVVSFPVNAGNNWPLKGGKGMPWEGGTRSSSFVWSPLLKDTSRVSNQLMHVTDWIHTLLGSFKKEPEGQFFKLDGINNWRALNEKDAETERNDLVYMIDSIDNFSAVRKGNWKMTVGSSCWGLFDKWYSQPERDGRSYDISAVETSQAAQVLASTSKPLPSNEQILSLRGQATINDCPVSNGATCNTLSQEPCLFDLETDPCERVNLADSQPLRVKQLKHVLDKYMGTFIHSLAVPGDDRANPEGYNNTWASWCDIVNCP